MAALTRMPAVAAAVRYRRTFLDRARAGRRSASWAGLPSEPKHFLDFDHGDLAIHPRLLVPEIRPRTGDLYRAVRRKEGKVLKNSPLKGGMVLKNLSLA